MGSLKTLWMQCENRVILGHRGITEDAANTVSYPVFPILGDRGIYEEIGGYFQQSAYQMLTNKLSTDTAGPFHLLLQPF